MANATVPCPHCQAPVTVAVGQVERCPACGGEVRVAVESVMRPASTPPPGSVPNPIQSPRPVSRNYFWFLLAIVAMAILAVRSRELSELRQQEADAEWPSWKISRVKVGMTVAEAEAIMGPGQKGTASNGVLVERAGQKRTSARVLINGREVQPVADIRHEECLV